jgi:hypothetical protein
MRIARTVAVVLVLAAAIGFLGWRHSSGSPAKPRRAAVVPIAGAVFMEQGGGIPSGDGSGIHSFGPVPVLVTGVTVSGRRLRLRVIANRDGHFKLTLAPGNYTFTGEAADKPSTTVRVRVGQTRRPLPVWVIDYQTVTMGL